MGTVSNTLNNPEKVSESTRRRVLASIAQLGFVRNDAARSLAAGSSSTVGLVVADLGNSLFVDIARGAEEVMRRRGMSVLIANSDIDPQKEISNLELFEQARVAGIMFAPLDTPLVQSAKLPLHSTPTVLVNFRSLSDDYAGVVVDERHGGEMAARHLLNAGRRRLIFAGGPFFLGAVSERYDGALKAVADVPGASLDLIKTNGLKYRHGREAAAQIIERGEGRIDGVICASDLVAIGLMQAMNGRQGFLVPADIAVTGYDNNHFAAETTIPVTTVSQPGEEMGRVAADLLLEKIAEPTGKSRTVVLEPTLIPRASSYR